MLTIRLKQSGVLRAFQTNRVATLLKRADKAYTNIMHLIVESEYPGDTQFIGGVPTLLSERTELSVPPLAALQLNTPIDRGVSDSLDDARVICLYEGDTMKVIDCGAILFEWPTREA